MSKPLYQRLTITLIFLFIFSTDKIFTLISYFNHILFSIITFILHVLKIITSKIHYIQLCTLILLLLNNIICQTFRHVWLLICHFKIHVPCFLDPNLSITSSSISCFISICIDLRDFPITSANSVCVMVGFSWSRSNK